MNIIMNHLNGFNVVVSHPVDPTRPEYNTKFAVSITPSRQIGNFNGKQLRCKEDVYYVNSWDTAMHYYRDLVKYATENKVN